MVGKPEFVARVMLFATAIWIVLPLAALAQEYRPGEAWVLSRGGKLYDNHWVVNSKSPPVKASPGFPESREVPAGTTWRCVSCHGWDYAGNDGHLGRGGRYPAFASLREAAGKQPVTVREAMLSPDHKVYMQGLSNQQIDFLALFVAQGQYNALKLLRDGKSIGDAVAGKDIYEGACISCHQADGKAFIEGEIGDQPALGWVANNRPAQALHKFINGVPGADMLSLRFLPEQSRADLLAYLQTLDQKADN